jgi:baseplate upper protein BppU/tail fiber-like repeat protein/tail-like repeat protein
MIKTFNITLDIEKELYSPLFSLFVVSEMDLDSVDLLFQINQEDQHLDLTGTTVELAIKKPSGLTVYQECEISNAPEGEAVVRLSLQSYNEFGTYTAELYIRNADQLAVTCPFYYSAREAVMNDQSIESTNDWSALQEALFSMDKKPVLTDGVPTFIPEYVGQMAFDETGKRAFISNGLTAESWQLLAAGEGGGGGIVYWADVIGKPLTFSPSAHEHIIAEITGLQAALDAKANLGEVGGAVDWADVQNKPLTFAPEVHSHSWGEITAKPTTFAPTAHTHLWAEITDKPTTFTPATHSHDYASITNKPTTFTPATHTHLWADITDKPATFAPSAHSHDYASITGKPTTFTPSAHTHAIAEVTGLQTALDGKADDADLTAKADKATTYTKTEVYNKTESYNRDEVDTMIEGVTTGGGVVIQDNLTSTNANQALSANQGRVLDVNKADKVHTHLWADITDKPTTFTPATHTHDWTDVTGKPTTFAPSAHTHAIAEVTGLQGALDLKADDTDLAGKANVTHTHLWADITDKPTTFAPTAHTHAWTEVTGKPTTFTPTAHTHAIADVTNLQSTLDGKADDADLAGKSDVGHTHAWTEITAKPTTFTPTAHTHLWADLTDKPTTFAPTAHTHAWTEVTGKPTTFTPTAHTHLWADITDKPATFTPTTHTHLWADITDKPTTFTPPLMSGAAVGGAQVGNGLGMSGNYLFVKTLPADGTKIDTVNNAIAIDRSVVDTWYASATHTHAWTDITGKPTTFTPTAHTHLWADITDKPTTFAPTAHTHTISEVTGLQTALDNKVDDSQMNGLSLWKGTQAAYDALTKDANTLYFISG